MPTETSTNEQASSSIATRVPNQRVRERDQRDSDELTDEEQAEVDAVLYGWELTGLRAGAYSFR